MVKDIIIIVLSVLLIIVLRKRLISLAKKLIPKKYYNRLKRFIKGIGNNNTNNNNTKSFPIYPILSKNQEENLSNAIRLTFTGDLILLKDMVENGYDPSLGQYSFDSMFKHVKEYYDEADYNIGVFEGPVAGADKGYSTSCFNDGIPLYLNFPKEYAEAVKRTGFDIVTLANNHLLDQGVEGMYHTLDELDYIELAHVGAYRNDEEKSSVRIVEVRGKRIAILAYTFHCNYYKTEFFFEPENKHLTNYIVAPDSPFINETLDAVRKDFEKAKSLSPDLIVVLPHMGKQFMHAPDEFQKYWCKVFVEFGADIVFSDHPHAVQPIEWVKDGNRTVLIVHCPGNFINSFIGYDGDASMIVECYLDPKTGKPFASACIPIYAYSKYGRSHLENYSGIPIYKLMKDETICPELSKFEYYRVQEVQRLVTKTAIGVELGLDQIQKRYYTFPDLGYVRQSTDKLPEKQFVNSDGKIIDMIERNDKIAFVGDSLTEGTFNGGYGWFEPMMQHYPNKQMFRFAVGSQTSKFFKENKNSIAALKADLYFLAMGCNDIRYRNDAICAMNESEYVANIDELCQSILEKQPSAEVICISPWKSGRYDPNCRMTLAEKEKLYDKYGSALKKYCEAHGFVFVDPNPFIEAAVSKRDRRYYMLDHIHCNADQGIKLYSEAVMMSC
jgi:poly-gamma-glutamate capsule biosynthesis protein CapA/YwtB (metallophosphatase superfamily)/lysophospholipase L1-like esterase